MHSVSKLVADSDNYVAQDRVSAVGVGLYPNDVLVLYAKLLSSLGCEVDMALCYDNALLDRYLACRTSQCTSRSTCDIAALADSNAKTDGACVGSGKLYLIS